ncbi:MAG: DUF2148 domain-containing protein [Rikenellaceae bacterium]
MLKEQDARKDSLLSVAKDMMIAARTAPKGKGVDNLEIVTLTGDDLQKLSSEMRRLSEINGFKFYLRDANNVDVADAVVVIGTRYGVFGLDCGFCGFPTCSAKAEAGEGVPCAFNTTDLGIAVGSAASVAMDHRVDTRIMYSAGDAAMHLGFVGDTRAAFAILMSSTGKNPFFDRK